MKDSRAGVAPTAPGVSPPLISKAPWPRSPSTVLPRKRSRNTMAPTASTKTANPRSFFAKKSVCKAVLTRTSLGRRILLPWVSTKGIAGLRMKGLQRTCASARYTRLIVLPRFLCVWLSNSRAKKPEHIGLFGNEDAQNPRPRSQEKSENQSTQNSRPALLPKIPMAHNGLALSREDRGTSLCSRDVGSLPRCIVEGSASFSPLSQPILAQAEWSFTLPTRRVPIQPARPTACSLQAKTMPAVGASGNGGLALFSNASRSAWQPPMADTIIYPRKARSARLSPFKTHAKSESRQRRIRVPTLLKNS